ncbi:MAG: protein kinase [Pirellulaceae bacterium]|nr:protein kinase [Pirellulaceae bacterium]
MSHQHDLNAMTRPNDLRTQLESVCRAYEKAWENNENPDIQSFARQVPTGGQADAIAILILLDVKLRLAAGEKLLPQSYIARFPGHESTIETAFGSFETPVSDLMSVGEQSSSEQADYPRKLGRYEVVSELGAGGFGVVCLARDVTLERMVALKFGLRSKFRTDAHVSAFIREARTIAQLQHPSIVTIHDVLQVDQWLCIVQQFVDDGDLRQHLKAGPFPFVRTIEICRQLASGLAFSHSRGFVHCDIKPANILMDKSGNPYIADFGLAIHEVNRIENGARAGTPRYMPPEVVMGETHRIDGRADIWSLGVMMYEMLTGVSPFRGTTQDELFDQIRYSEPRQPRSLVSSLPRELERICLKCLSKSVLERYRTAQELCDDLEHWTAEPDSGTAGPGVLSTRVLTDDMDSMRSERDPSFAASSGASAAIRVVPRGLQSYNEHDAEFFLQLIPGPRDREGFPESVRFWRNWVHDSDPNINSVGLLYGPSGSGKSSFIKAGLLPRLPNDVLVVYVEATHNETETRLLRELRKKLPALPRDVTLARALEQIRDGKFLPYGKKLLLVFDQFEQWLNDRVITTQEELVRGLRHCDGERVRALILIRDDFWLPANRLMHELDVELNLGRNAKLIDLFDTTHARKVLYEFGCSYGVLPRDVGQLNKSQRRFIREAVAGLAEQDRVVSVRLAIFAEMFRDRPWTVAELNRVGGAQGVGYKFLEGAFDSVHSNPQNRALQREARLLLEALVPVGGQQIRGRMLPLETLRDACGMNNRPVEFNALLKVLDSDLRLITPIGVTTGEESTKTEGNPTTHYQLTHDFLVGSLRDWLTQKKRSTRRGRAELCLADRAESWTLKPENRHLPTALEFLNIRTWTKAARWTPPQGQMMRVATTYYGLRLLLTLCLSCLFGWGLFAFLEARHADNLVEKLMQAETSEVPKNMQEISEVRNVRSRIEYQLTSGQSLDARQKLHLELGKWLSDPSDSRFICEKLPDLTSLETKVVTEVTRGNSEQLVKAGKSLLDGGTLSAPQRVAVFAAMAQWDSDSNLWETLGPLVAQDIVLQSRYELVGWVDLLKPVADDMLPTLTQMIREAETTPELPLDIYAILKDASTEKNGPLWRALDSVPPRVDLDKDVYVRRSIQQARLAAALIRMGERDGRLWNFLRSDENLTRRSYMIEYFPLYKVDPEVLVDQLEKNSEPQIIAALLMGLGSYPDRLQLPERLFPFVESSCFTSRDGFVRGCAEWLYRVCDRPIPKTNRAIDGANWMPIPVDGVDLNLVRVKAPGAFKLGSGKEVFLNDHFWISSTEVPISAYRKFEPNYPLPKFDPLYNTEPITDSHPACVNGNHLAEYCNWLSEQCGIPPSEYCFEEIPESELDFEPNGIRNMRLVADWQQKRGYRLPSEAEWEWACQSETPNSWNFGRSGEHFIMQHYVWNRENAARELATRAVGRLKPNRLGLFDFHGNAYDIVINMEEGDPKAVLRAKGGSVFGFDSDPSSVSQSYSLSNLSAQIRYTSFRVFRLN